MIDFIKTPTPEPGIEALTGEISATLRKGKPVLWLISGGSNVAISVEVMNRVRRDIRAGDSDAIADPSADALSRLTVSLTDERYGPVGHADSNWQQLIDSGFSFGGIESIPVLKPAASNAKPEEISDLWGTQIRVVTERTKASDGLIVGQFGMGVDGHIAGIVPRSPATADPTHSAADPRGSDIPMAYAYRSRPFIRVTLSFAALRSLDSAYLFAFGEAKAPALSDLRGKSIPLDIQPAQILKEMPKASVYTDQS